MRIGVLDGWSGIRIAVGDWKGEWELVIRDWGCTIPQGTVMQELGRSGLNEQVPKVWKKCNCDYLV